MTMTNLNSLPRFTYRQSQTPPDRKKKSITKLRGGSSGSGVSSPHLIQKGGISPIILGRIIQWWFLEQTYISWVHPSIYSPNLLITPMKRAFFQAGPSFKPADSSSHVLGTAGRTVPQGAALASPNELQGGAPPGCERWFSWTIGIVQIHLP